MKNKEFDLGVYTFGLTYDRNKVVDYTVAFQDEVMSILIPPPIPESRLFTCIRPFHWQVLTII